MAEKKKSEQSEITRTKNESKMIEDLRNEKAEIDKQMVKCLETEKVLKDKGNCLLDIQDVFESWKESLQEIENWEERVSKQTTEVAKRPFVVKLDELKRALPATAQQIHKELKAKSSNFDLYFTLPNGRLTTEEECDEQIQRAEEKIIVAKEQLDKTRKEIQVLKEKQQEAKSKLDRQIGFEDAKRAEKEAFEELRDELFAELRAGLRTGKEEELLVDGKVTDIRRWVHRDGWKPTRGVGEDLLAYEKELSGITNLPGVITRCVNWMKDDFEQAREFARKKAEASGDKQKMDMWERVALPDTMTWDEKLSVRIYTDHNGTAEKSLYKNLVWAQQDATPARLEPYRGFMFYLYAAMDKFPKIPQTVYRGMSNCRDLIKANYTLGRPVVWRAFQSTSYMLDKAKEFYRDPHVAPDVRGGGVIVKIESLNGRHIEALNRYPEGEVLLSPGTRFIVSSEVYEGKDGMWYLDLKEVSTDTYYY